MTEQNDIGTAPAAPEDESPFLDENVEEEVAEEGEDGDPDDYYLGRVDKLLRLDQTGELPRLTPQSIFGNATTRERVSPERKERFASRLTFFMKSQSRPLLSSELVDFLFDRAMNVERYITAWDTFVKNTRSADLKTTRAYLREELNRQLKIRSVLKEKKKRTPGWMSEWSRCWVGALEEIQEEIEGDLRCALRTVDELRKARTSARVEVESYALWLEKQQIRKHPSAARRLEVVLPAFAYAAMLVEPKSEDIDDLIDFAALIKQRISRVARSEEKRNQALSIRLRAMLEP